MLNERTVLLGLTTKGVSNWQDKALEVKQLKIETAALLPTTLSFAERKRLYQMLEEAGLAEATVVQLRPDMEQRELDYLVARFKTKIFCCHADEAGLKLIDSLPKYHSMIYLANHDSEHSGKYFNQTVFEQHQLTGICLDLSHLENQRNFSKNGYRRVQSLLNKYPLGCNMVSGISESVLLKLFKKSIDTHYLKSLDQLEYLRKFPSHYFAKLVVLQLENSFQEQLAIKKHLQNILEYMIQ